MTESDTDALLERVRKTLRRMYDGRMAVPSEVEDSLTALDAIAAELERRQRIIDSVTSKTALDVVAEKMGAEDRARAAEAELERVRAERDSLERFATHDPGVAWPSSKHTDPGDAIMAALDLERERTQARLDEAVRLLQIASGDPDWHEFALRSLRDGTAELLAEIEEAS